MFTSTFIMKSKDKMLKCAKILVPIMEDNRLLKPLYTYTQFRNSRLKDREY